MLSPFGGGPAIDTDLLHVRFTDPAEMVAVDGEDDGFGDKPGAAELGPDEELPVVEPFPAEDADPDERAQERQDVG